MEEKKLDINSIIGFILIFGILVYMMYTNQPTPEEVEAQEKAKQEQVEIEQNAKEKEKESTIVTTAEDFSAATVTDSIQLVALNNKLGAFAYSAIKSTDKETVVESDLLALKFNNKGGYLSEVRLKEFVDYDSIPIFMIKDNNASFNINFGTTDSRILNTKDLPFIPSVTKNGDITIISMKLKVSESQFLEYRYELKPDDYMMGFSIKSQGLSNVINNSQDVNLDWRLKTYRHAKSISYENRYTDLHYEYDGGKDAYLGQRDDEEIIDDVFVSTELHDCDFSPNNYKVFKIARKIQLFPIKQRHFTNRSIKFRFHTPNLRKSFD